MIRVSIYYPNTPESRFNLDYYLSEHIPLVEKLLTPAGMDKVVVDEGIGTPMPGSPVAFSVIAHLLFNNFEEMQTALGEHSAALMSDLPNFTNVEPVVQINRVIKGV